jgi:hypothetical protein
MTLEIRNITSGHRYCSIQSNIVPQIGSTVNIDCFLPTSLQVKTILKVEDVVYNLFPSSDEILCEVLVKQHIGKVIELERDDSLRPLLK